MNPATSPQRTVSGDATPGGTLTFDTTGTAGLLVMLFLGSADGETLLKPYGSVFFDLTSPWTFFPFGFVGDSFDVVVPDLPVGTELFLQELALDMSTAAGNFSNPVRLVIE